MVVETQFIKHDFNLPDHSTQLQKAEEVINKLKDKLKNIETTKSITDELHTKLYEEVIRILDYVGKLSMSAFDIEEEIERLYTLQFQNSPQLGKKLCNDHYEKIHHPYTLLKNRCFKMLEDLDEEYKERWKKNPPNWNI
jgi:hypothetical protein